MRICIIHFQPLELYPPIQNLLSSISGSRHKLEVYCLTTTNNSNLDEFSIQNIAIHRTPGVIKKEHFIFRFWKYFWFNVYSTLFLIRYRPSKVLYYETLSAFGPWLYKRWLNTKADLLIHYHEYSSLEEYQNGMVLCKAFHRLEKQLYSEVQWLSHTNEERMKLFLQDNNGIIIQNTHIFPNYPPIMWREKTLQSKQRSYPIKTVYVGALSCESMYLKEYCHWIINQEGRVYFDQYSYNYSDEAKKFISSLQHPAIRLHEGVGYQELPGILKDYDVGLILYKGHIPNFVYNAPNKLFEYLACGLDVWFPQEMAGCEPYITKNTHPRVVKIDFKRLNALDFSKLIDNRNLQFAPSEFFHEKVSEKLINVLMEQ